MLGFRYQRTSLTSALFENGIFVMNVEFTFTLEIEAILIVEYITRSNPNLESTPYADNLLKPASFTSVNDAVYTITVGIIQREEKILATMSQEQEKGGPRDDHIGG